MKFLKLTLLGGILVALLAFAGSVLAPSQVLADAKSDVCAGIGAISGSGSCSPADPDTPTVNNLIGTIVNILSVVVGIAAVIMVIIGGFKYVTSQGDSAATTSARNTILYAVVGLVVAAMAQILVRFVLVKLS